MNITANIYADAIYIMYKQKEINLFVNYVNRIESWRLLVRIADDLNNERCLVNWGLYNEKQGKIKLENKEKRK